MAAKDDIEMNNPYNLLNKNSFEIKCKVLMNFTFSYGNKIHIIC